MSGLITFGDDYAFDLLTMFYYSSREVGGGERGGETRLDLLFSLALGKVKKDYSCPQWERKSWGIVMAFELAMCLHHDRPALWRSRRICKTDSGTFLPYLLLTSLNFPHQRGPGTTSQAFLRAWAATRNFKGLLCQLATTLEKLESGSAFHS